MLTFGDAAHNFKNEDSIRVSSPESLLWGEVLVGALIDAQRPPGDDRRDALAWIHDDDFNVGGFLWVCDALSLSPSCVRRALQNGTVAIDGRSRVMPLAPIDP